MLLGIRNLLIIVITNTNLISLLSSIWDRSRIKASFLFKKGKIDIKLLLDRLRKGVYTQNAYGGKMVLIFCLTPSYEGVLLIYIDIAIPLTMWGKHVIISRVSSVMCSNTGLTFFFVRSAIRTNQTDYWNTGSYLIA